MIRTQISLTSEQKRRLEKKSAETGLSVAELVRRAVDQSLGSEHNVEAAVAALHRASGIWKDRDFTGEEYVERMRTGRRLREVLERGR